MPEVGFRAQRGFYRAEDHLRGLGMPKVGFRARRGFYLSRKRFCDGAGRRGWLWRSGLDRQGGLREGVWIWRNGVVLAEWIGSGRGDWCWQNGLARSRWIGSGRMDWFKSNSSSNPEAIVVLIGRGHCCFDWRGLVVGNSREVTLRGNRPGRSSLGWSGRQLSGRQHSGAIVGGDSRGGSALLSGRRRVVVWMSG